MFARLKLYAMAAGAFIVALLGAWVMGRREGRQRARDKARDAWIDTRKRMDAADTANDASSARDWLRERQSKRDM